MTIALWCVLAASLMPLIFSTAAKAGRRFDNHHVREDLARLTGWRARANAAQLNSFEAFPVFAAATIIGHLLEGPQDKLDTLAIAWIVLRLVYGGLYIANIAWLRSLIWFAALGCAIAMYAVSA